MDAEHRLKLIVRTVNLLRQEIERNGGRYSGSLVPNLQSISDLATVDAKYLVGASLALAELERERSNPEGT